jgi:hypothetical protein
MKECHYAKAHSGEKLSRLSTERTKGDGRRLFFPRTVAANREGWRALQG